MYIPSRPLQFAFPSLVRVIVVLFALAVAATLPRFAHAHGGECHAGVPQQVVVPLAPAGPYRAYLPAINQNSAPGDCETQDSHSRNDYVLAEEARQRNEPAFAVPPDVQAQATAANENIMGQWGPTRTWPFVMATAANLPDGRLIAWGGNNTTSFNGGTNTYAAVWDPATDQITSYNNTNHSMFCAIPTMLEDGRVFVNGGDGTRERTSTFDFRTNAWTRLQDMSTGRWYNGAVALPNGKVFTMLGDPGGNYPEIWTPNQGWSLLTGANLQASIITYTAYQHTWLPYLHLAPSGLILNSGPTQVMNWLNPTGNGAITPTIASASWYPKYGVGVMYDIGKILVAGGASQRSTSNTGGTNQALTIDINGATPVTTSAPSMANARKFANAVVLPTGEVLVIGGNTSGVEFSDSGTILAAEIWNPTTRAWRTVASASVPRNYHSVALLLPDGRVWSGGGGLCACSADHPDHQIYSPPYLFNADGSLAARPVITSAPGVAVYGRSITVTATAGMQKFSLIKMSGTTHNLNSDLRFINVPFTGSNGSYQLTLNNNINVLTPGYWMLFAVNANGVPSVAKIIQIASSGLPRVTHPGPQTTVLNTSVSLGIQAADPDGTAITFSASGLPNGLSINSSSGLVSGVATAIGTYTATITARDAANETTVITVPWSVRASAAGLNYEYYEGVWSALPDFNTLTPVKTGVVATFDISPRNNNDNFAFRFKGKIVLAASGVYTFYTSSDDGSQLRINNALVVNNDGLHGVAEQQGVVTLAAGSHDIEVTFFEAGGSEALTVSYAGPGVAKQAIPAPVLSLPIALAVVNPGSQTGRVNDVVALTVFANDVATFSANGLPNGLTINPNGSIAGTLNTAGTFSTIVTATRANGQAASAAFAWQVNPPLVLALNPITTTPRAINTSVVFTATAINAVNPRYKWLFGDGTAETAYSTSATASHAFAQPGLYVVKATVTDNSGLEKSVTFVQAIHLPPTANKPSTSTNIVFETRATGNSRVWVVNQDNDTVSVFDAVTNGKLAEIAVGNKPRSIAIAPNGNVWVVNKGTASISVINPTTLAVAQTITLPAASQPFGLAFSPAGGSAFVVLEAGGKLLKLDAATGAQTGSLDIGLNARGVAVSADGATVYVSRFVTPRLPGEETAVVTVNASVGGQVLSISAASMALNTTIILQHSDKPDTEVQGAGVPNYLGALAISPDGVSAWVPSKQDNIKRGVLRNGAGLNFQNTVRAITSRVVLAANSEDVARRVDHDNSSVTSAAAFDRYGNYLFTALETSREVAVVDAYTGGEIWRFAVGRAPQGLAVSADGLRLYVNNFMDRTVSVFDLSKLITSGEKNVPLVATLTSVASEKLAANVLVGKQFFYDAKDPRLARDSYMSCASCHNDGGQDGRVWDFTGFGEGLRNTIALSGRAATGHGFVHWSGNFDEVQDFEGQIRNFAGGTGLMTDAQFNTGTRSQPLGDPKAGLSADLDALVAYMMSLNTFAPSPYRTNGALTTAATAGRQVFMAANCAQCHSGAPFTNSAANTLVNIGTIKPSSGQRLNGSLTGIDVPTLRDVWATAPYLHDGSAATIDAAISAHTGLALNATDLSNLAAYVQQIGDGEISAPVNSAPSVTLTAPLNNATFTAPATVTLTANATDADGTISKVEFYSGTTKLGEDTTAPYAYVWTSVPAGAYAIAAKATDNIGVIASTATANIVVNTSEPVGNDRVVYGDSLAWDDWSWNIGANYTAASPVRVGSASAAITFNSGWAAVIWRTAPVSTASYTALSFWVYGNSAGNTRFYVFTQSDDAGSSTSPYFAVTAPANTWTKITIPLASLGNPTAIGKLILQENSGAAQPAFYLDDVRLVSNGTPNTPPTVALTSPAVNAVFETPVTVDLAANAADSDGIAKVEFYDGAIKLGEDTSAPFTFAWVNPPTGTRSLTAKAFDTLGASTTSAAVPITVNAGAVSPDFVIYGDALAAGWLDWSWNAPANYGNASPVKVGTASMAVTFTSGWGGFVGRAPAPLSTNAYAGLAFWVYGASPSGTRANVYVQGSDSGAPSNYVNINVPAGVWTRVTIPWASFGNPTAVARLNIQDSTGAAQPVFYLDDVRLVGAGTPLTLSTSGNTNAGASLMAIAQTEAGQTAQIDVVTANPSPVQSAVAYRDGAAATRMTASAFSLLPLVTVNGVPVTVTDQTMAATDGAVWLRLTFADGTVEVFGLGDKLTLTNSSSQGF